MRLYNDIDKIKMVKENQLRNLYEIFFLNYLAINISLNNLF